MGEQVRAGVKCSRCGLGIVLQNDGLGAVWLAEEKPRAVCPASKDDPVPRFINHVPSVETEDEVLLEQLAQMPPAVIERYRRAEQREQVDVVLFPSTWLFPDRGTARALVDHVLAQYDHDPP